MNSSLEMLDDLLMAVLGAAELRTTGAAAPPRARDKLRDVSWRSEAIKWDNSMLVE